MTPTLIILALIVLFTAAFAKSILGFGEALVAIPLLTLILGLQAAAPVSMLMASSVTLILMLKNWRAIDLGAIWRLILASVFGIPLGVWGLKQLPEVWLTTLLGVLLILIGLYYLRRPTLPALMGNVWSYVFGFLAGILGGAYNIAGPPLIVYGTMRRWSPDQFRSTLQGFFIIIDVIILVGHAVSGLWTPVVLQVFILSIPAILVGFWAGNRVSARISAPMFERILYVTLIVVGVMLIV